MFTRFKTMTMLLIFCLSFVLAEVFLGENGVLARKALQQELERVESVRMEKEAQIVLLRENGKASQSEEVYAKDLVHAFSSSALPVYEPEVTVEKTESVEGFHGYSVLRCFLMALVPSGLYAAFVLSMGLLGEKEGTEEEKKKDYASYDD